MRNHCGPLRSCSAAALHLRNYNTKSQDLFSLPNTHYILSNYLCVYIHVHESCYIIQKIILLSLFYTLFLYFSYVFSYADTVTLGYVTEPLGHGSLIRSVDNTSIYFVELLLTLKGVVYKAIRIVTGT